MADLTFLGAAQTVTGSKHLLTTSAGRQVLVDCGQFQGSKALRERNWQAMPFRPSALDAVVLTHAHLDHCGLLPRLVAAGFAGRIFCTPGTRDLCSLILPDAGRIQEEDARQANKHGYTRHRPALPLFTEADALRALTHLQPVSYGVPVPVADGVDVEFLPAGHLLGSAFVRMTLRDDTPRTLLFGGDLGRYDRPILPDPTQVDEADVLLLESTYGDRLHVPDDEGAGLAEVIGETWRRGGKLVIPSFAVGRAGELIYWIDRLEREKRIPSMPVFVDSPMAGAALRFYASHPAELDEEVRPASRREAMFSTNRLTIVDSVQESKAIADVEEPAIIISASGMATGGRVLHHLKRYLPDPRSTVLFVGFQAAGTRGRQLVDGATFVKIHGQVINVAARVLRNDQMSAHADRDEIMRWLGGFSRPPACTYLVHGEPESMTVLRTTIEAELGWTVATPAHGERVTLPAEATE